MRIRRASGTDRPALLRMAERFIAETGYRSLITPNREQFEALVTFLLQHGAVWVADGPAGVYGMLAVTVIAHPISGERTGSEVAWWVEPEFRGGTTAIRLLAAAETWAREQGAVRFQMIAPAGSGLGRHYVRRGYLEVETVYQRTLSA